MLQETIFNDSFPRAVTPVKFHVNFKFALQVVERA